MNPKKACVSDLILILRPMLPQYAHLAVDQNGNSLLVVDTFANAKRLQSIVGDMDARSISNGQCGSQPAKRD